MRRTVALLALVACSRTSSPDAARRPPDAAAVREPRPIAIAAGTSMPATLHEAALRCDHDGVVKLLGEKAEVDTRNHEGRTPLHEAAGRCGLTIVKRLVDAGADVRARDADGMTPLHEACAPSRAGSGPHAIWRAGDAQVVAFLIDAGADPRAETHTGWTPLHAAAQAADGGGEVVTLLLDRGARVDARDALGWTPLHYAARFDAVDVTRVLLARGAPVDARTALPRKVPSTVYPAGATPLDVARASGSSRAGELLSR